MTTAVPGVFLAKYDGILLPDEAERNSEMIPVRQGVEDFFKDFRRQNSHFRDFEKHKILARRHITIKQELLFALTFQNLHACVYGNQNNALGMVAAPTMERYYRNVQFTPPKISQLL